MPLSHPERAAIVSSPRIFGGLVAPPQHGMSPEDRPAFERAKARDAFIVVVMGEEHLLPDETTARMLAQIVSARGGQGAPTAADSDTLRQELPGIIARMISAQGVDERAGPTRCHDITVYPALGPAGGACEGYGCCSTSATRSTSSASRRSPTRNSPTGTRRPSTTTAPSSS